MFRLSDGEEIMTLAFFVLIQYRSVTDGRTDRQTDGHLCSGYTSACIACYANALVKTIAADLSGGIFANLIIIWTKKYKIHCHATSLVKNWQTVK